MNDSQSKQELLYFLDLISEKSLELANLIGNIGNIIGIDKQNETPTPDAEEKKYTIDAKKLAESKKLIEKYIRVVDKRQKKIQYQFVYETWLARNNITNKLEPVTHEHWSLLSMGSFKKRSKRIKNSYSPSDPDEIQKSLIDQYVIKTFKWLLDEKKQHRIDITFPHKSQCAIGVM